MRGRYYIEIYRSYCGVSKPRHAGCTGSVTKSLSMRHCWIYENSSGDLTSVTWLLSLSLSLDKSLSDISFYWICLLHLFTLSLETFLNRTNTCRRRNSSSQKRSQQGRKGTHHQRIYVKVILGQFECAEQLLDSKTHYQPQKEKRETWTQRFQRTK